MRRACRHTRGGRVEPALVANAWAAPVHLVLLRDRLVCGSRVHASQEPAAACATDRPGERPSRRRAEHSGGGRYRTEPATKPPLARYRASTDAGLPTRRFRAPTVRQLRASRDRGADAPARGRRRSSATPPAPDDGRDRVVAIGIVGLRPVGTQAGRRCLWRQADYADLGRSASELTIAFA